MTFSDRIVTLHNPSLEGELERIRTIIRVSSAPSKQGNIRNSSLITGAPKVYTPTVAKSHNVLPRCSNVSEHFAKMTAATYMRNATNAGYTNEK